MTRTTVLTLAAALALAGCASRNGSQATPAASPATPSAAADTAKPRFATGQQVETTAMVEAVDRENRTVTLRGSEGRTVTIRVPEGVQAFDTLAPGDRVRARYTESMAIAVETGTGEPSSSVSRTETAPRSGQAGGRAVAEVREIRANVEAIDYDARTLALRGPDGRTVQLKVDPSVERFDNVRVGDQVVVRYMEALGVSLEKL